MASALCSSPYEVGVTIVTPFVSEISSMASAELNLALTEAFFCRIDFNFDLADEAISIAHGRLNGGCWHQLFRNPVIVGGYPIPRRKSKSDVGLEIDLDTMANLMGTHYVDIFQNKVFIKGFSTMLVPVLQTDNVIFWHLLQNRNGDRISYLDSKIIHADGVKLSHLETARHILGWCSKAMCLAGRKLVCWCTLAMTC